MTYCTCVCKLSFSIKCTLKSGVCFTCPGPGGDAAFLSVGAELLHEFNKSELCHSYAQLVVRSLIGQSIDTKVLFLFSALSLPFRGRVG